MLQILIVWLYIYVTSYCAGRLLIDVISAGREYKPVHPVLTSLVGLIAIMVIAGYLSIVWPTGLIIHLVLVAITLLYILKHRRRVLSVKSYVFSFARHYWLPALLLVSVMAMVLVKTSGPITTADSGAYHLPFIKWIENYRAIIGTANVHARFGFNYQYHVLCAVYGFAFLGLPTLHALNGYLMMAVVVYLTTTMSYFRNKVLSKLDLVKLVTLLFVLNMSNAVSSLSPDFPATALVVIIVLLTVQRLEEGKSSFFDVPASIIFLLSLGSILFKISTLPAFLFTLFFIIPLVRNRKWSVLTGLVIIATVFCLPYLIRNYIISGYLVFPLYSIDIFDVIWKVPHDKAIYEKDVVKSFAMGLKYGQEVSFTEGIVSWVNYLKTANRVYIYLLGILLVSVILNIAWFIRVFAGERNRQQTQYAYLYLLLYMGLVYWWLNAPDPRFGNGYIIPFIALNIAMAGYPLLKNMQQIVVTGSLLLLVGLCGFMITGKALSKSSMNFEDISYNIIRQQGYPLPDTMARIQSGQKVSYKVPNDRFCWECPQPCSMLRDSFRYIGNTIEEGFTSARQK